MRILSALLLAILLSSGCKSGEKPMPEEPVEEALMPPEVEEPVERTSSDEFIDDILMLFTADEARRRPEMVEFRTRESGQWKHSPFTVWAPFDSVFTPGDFGFLVLRFQNPPLSPDVVRHVNVYYRRSDVRIVSEEPSKALSQGELWNMDTFTTFALDANDEVVIPFVVRVTTICYFLPVSERYRHRPPVGYPIAVENTHLFGDPE